MFQRLMVDREIMIDIVWIVTRSRLRAIIDVPDGEDRVPRAAEGSIMAGKLPIGASFQPLSTRLEPSSDYVTLFDSVG